jgi:ABC-type transport system involved in cytochrome bd biosynthesis fused ATPase/permease subunit
MSTTDLNDKDHLIRAMQKDLKKMLTEESGDADWQLAGAQGIMTAILEESVRTQRLYFVVRSVLMSLISALVYFVVVLYLGAINAVQAAFLGVFVFIVALFVSRFFDKQIIKVSKRIISLLNKYKKIKAFVLKRL